MSQQLTFEQLQSRTNQSHTSHQAHPSSPSKPPELFPYQVAGAQWLADHRQALLADRQRLGKTVQAIRAADLVQSGINNDPYASKHQKRILVVCRAVAREQWKKEFERWQKTPRLIHVSQIGNKSPGLAPNPLPGSVTICSFEGLKRTISGLKGEFHIIIVDEAHYLKNPNAGRTRVLMTRAGLIHQTEYFWALTGTPAPNDISELWTLLRPFGSTELNFERFVTKYCETFNNGFGLQIKGTKTDSATVAEIQEMLSYVMLRRTEEDVDIELPRLFETTEFIEPGIVDVEETGLFSDEIEKYGRDGVLALIRDELGIMEGIVGTTASHQLIETLKASAKSISTVRRFTALQKVKAVAELVRNELESGAYEKVVVFGVHVIALEILAKELKDFDPVILYGKTSGQAQELIARFQDPKSGCKVFIGNINSAGTSISLTAANHIYFMEEAWTPGDNAQAKMRCGGVNQKKPIFVKRIILNNSIDQKVSDALNRKTEEQKIIFDSKQLTFDDLL